MTDAPDSGRWVSILTDFVVPAGALTALLFYFGYASTKAEYEYFGVDIDTVGLDTAGVLVRSPHSLVVPIVTVALLAAVGLLIHLGVRRFLAAPGPDSRKARRRLVLRRTSTIVATIGGAIVLGSVVLLFAYPWLVEWPAYNLVTPGSLIAGIIMFSYGLQLRRMAAATARPRQFDVDSPARTWLRVVSVIAVTGCAFWATSTLAQWSGTGQGTLQAQHFGQLPSVILDTIEPLQWHDPVITESGLPPTPGQTFRFRYRNLRLLIAGSDRLFLVPDRWSLEGTTYVVPLDGTVRVQFKFQNPG